MKHKLNRMIAMMLAVVLSFSMLLIPVEAASFRDVSDRAWYRAAVDYVHEKGWMNGVSETAFAPNTEVTRGMFVTVLARVAEADTDSSNPAFVDTPAGKWYTGAAAWAAQHGIVSGVGANRFAPNRSISRQDLCTMLYRFIEAQDLELEANADRTFADMDSVSGYARQPVGFCAAAGLVSGFEDGTFRPKSTATRAQVAAILMRLDKLVNGEEAPAEPMPAQNFEGEEQEGMSVSVQAPEGALPENTNMTVSPVTDEATLASLSEKVSGDLVAAADISFSKDGAELEPQAPVEVRIALEGLENLKNPVVYHIKDDGTAESVEAELISLTRSEDDKVLRFYANSFSVYAVYDVEGNENVNLTVVFHANGQIINKQIIRKAQLEDAGNLTPVFDPGVPNISTTESFEGWYLGDASSGNYSESDTGVSVAEINAYYKANVPAVDTTVHYYAMVYSVLYVVYHDQNGAVLETRSFHKYNGSATVDINKAYVAYGENQRFTEKWTPDILTTGNVPTYQNNPTLYENGSTPSITETLNLYPYVQKGHWLIFDNNITQNNTANDFDDPTTAKYIPPIFVVEGENTQRPENVDVNYTPDRKGYSLVDWYTSDDMSNAFIFGGELTQDTTVYAKWTPSYTTYTVIYMLQNATDTATENVYTDNTYYYYDSISRNWIGSSTVQVTTGQSVSAYTGGSVNDTTLVSKDLTEETNGYVFESFREDKTIHKLNKYFFYSGKNSGNTVRVRGDGSSILYVYYDRKVVTFKMYRPNTWNSTTPPYNDTSRIYYAKDSNYNYYYPLTYSETNDQTATYKMWRYQEKVWAYVTFNTYPYNSSWYYADDLTSWKLKPGNAPTFYYPTFTQIDSDKKGLFGHPMTSDDWGWTLGTKETWYNKNCTMNTPYNKLTFDADPYYVDDNDEYTFNYYLGYYCEKEPKKTIHFKSQNPETGDWDIANDYDALTIDAAYVRTFSDLKGRKLVGLNATQNSREENEGYIEVSNRVHIRTDPTDGQTTIDGSNETIYGIKHDDAYLYYELVTSNLAFISKGQVVDQDSLRYLQRLAPSEYDENDPEKLFIPKYGALGGPAAGEYFAGWYADPVYQSKFDFSGVMGDTAKTAYAKWKQAKYRVVLNYDPNGDNVARNGAQGTFLVNAGEQIDKQKLEAFTCEGKRFMGWYLDPECKTKPFNPDTILFSEVSDDEDYLYYGEIKPTETVEHYNARMNGSERTGTHSLTNETWDDRWDTNDPDADTDSEIRGKLTLYALWVDDPGNSIGMRVKYLANNHPDTGHFGNTTDTEWWDPYIYTDHSWAYAQPASVPDRPADQQFLYWEILDHEGQPTGRKVYPGQLFEILFDDAYQGTEPPTNCEHTVREYVEAVAPTCETAGNSGHYRCTNCGRRFATDDPSDTTVINPTIPALGHDWTGKTYTWDSTVTPWTCTATATCSRNPAHTLSETVNGVWYVDTKPSGQSAGSGHYEASFTNTSVFTAQTSSPVEIPQLTEVTVSFSVPAGVAPVADMSAEPGSSITLPSAGAPSGLTFLGWTNAPVSNASSAPSYSASGTDFTVPDEGATLYALYSYTAAGSYSLLTAAPADWSGNYVITAGKTTSMYVMKNAGIGTAYENANSGGHAAFNSTGMTLSSNTLTNVSDSYVFEIGRVTDNDGTYYTLKNREANAWLNYPTSNYDLALQSSVDSGNYWSLSYSSGGVKAVSKKAWGGWFLAWWSDGFFYTSDSFVTNYETQFWKETTETKYTTAVPFSSNSRNLSWQGSHFYANNSQNSTRKIQFWKESSGTYYYTGSASGTSAVIGETESIGDAGLTANVNQTRDTAVLDLVSYNPSNPVRDGEPATEYNIFLRAVYGRYNPDATTYINWYANNGTDDHNGAGSRYQSTSTSHPLTPTKLDYNEEVPIPTPSTFEGDNGGLYWGGHEFLGWARVPVTGSGSDGTAQTLTADDLYLKWNGSRYEYNPHSDKESETDGWVTLTSGKVFADGDLPHYDMYAVWGPGCFYVLHSATGKLEAIPVTINNSGSGTGTTSVIAPFDLTALVSSGHLYGGYYTSYGGVSASAVASAVNEYERNPDQNTWTTDAGTPRMTYMCTAENDSFDRYTGASSTSSRNDVKFWTKANAYKPADGATEQQIADINGKTMRPVPGTVYYLKEVPEAYLAPKFQYVYDTAQNNNILNLFMLSVVDDSYYSKIGFKLAENVQNYTNAASSDSIELRNMLVKSFTIEQKGQGGASGKKVTTTASNFTSVSAGKVAVLQLDNHIASNKMFTMLPSWETLDGVQVEGITAFGLKFNEAKTAITKTVLSKS